VVLHRDTGLLDQEGQAGFSSLSSKQNWFWAGRMWAYLPMQFHLSAAPSLPPTHGTDTTMPPFTISHHTQLPTHTPHTRTMHTTPPHPTPIPLPYTRFSPRSTMAPHTGFCLPHPPHTIHTYLHTLCRACHAHLLSQALHAILHPSPFSARFHAFCPSMQPVRLRRAVHSLGVTDLCNTRALRTRRERGRFHHTLPAV